MKKSEIRKQLIAELIAEADQAYDAHRETFEETDDYEAMHAMDTWRTVVEWLKGKS